MLRTPLCIALLVCLIPAARPAAQDLASPAELDAERYLLTGTWNLNDPHTSSSATIELDGGAIRLQSTHAHIPEIDGVWELITDANDYAIRLLSYDSRMAWTLGSRDVPLHIVDNDTIEVEFQDTAYRFVVRTRPEQEPVTFLSAAHQNHLDRGSLSDHFRGEWTLDLDATVAATMKQMGLTDLESLLYLYEDSYGSMSVSLEVTPAGVESTSVYQGVSAQRTGAWYDVRESDGELVVRVDWDAGAFGEAEVETLHITFPSEGSMRAVGERRKLLFDRQ